MDFIQQLIEGPAKVLSKILGKENAHELVIENHQDDARDIDYLVNVHLREKRFDEAENLLFESMKKSPRSELFNTGIDFYNALSALSDEELSEGNFTRGEVTQGLADWIKLKDEG